MKWKVLSCEYITRHPYFTARKDRCEAPGGKIIEAYYVVELPTTVCALALTGEGDVIMVRQYRHPVGEILLELPGGFIDRDETPEEAIARELREETGYTFTSFERLGKIAANPGVLNNDTYLFLARGGSRTAGQQLDDNEEIDVEKLPLQEVKQLLLENRIRQSLHANCIFYALQRLGEL